MTTLRQALADNLAMRRALGYKLDRAELLLGQFITYLEHEHAETITIEHALAWATAPGGQGWWHAMRMSTVRAFAVYLHTIDISAEVPPKGMIAYRRNRPTPYIYSDADVRAMMAAARQLPQRKPAATYPVLIGLLAETGMRIGEALALDTADFDPELGVLTVRSGKLGKTRLLPLHPSTTAALTQYLHVRETPARNRTDYPLFASRTGTPLSYIRVSETYNRIVLIAAIAVTGATALSCSSPEVGDRIDLDVGEVADRADRNGVSIPTGFDFVEGATYVEFSGKASWSARYKGPAAYADGKAVSEANPSFPPLQMTDCSAAPPTGSDIDRSEACLPGFVTQLPSTRGPDSVTIRLSRDADGTQLTISSLGH